MAKDVFINWLKREIAARDWSQAEFARQTKLSPAQVTRLLNGERGVGENGLIAIAHAFKLPLETVFRAAGILPPQAPEDELMNEIMHLAGDLPAQDKQDILEYVRMRNRLAEERGKNESRTQRKPAAP